MRKTLGTFIQSLLLVLILSISQISAANLSSSQGKELYLSFDQRLAVTYALAAQGQNPDIQKKYLERAQNYFAKKWKEPTRHVMVRNFKEFLADFRGAWPGTHSLDVDLEWIESQPVKGFAVYEAISPRVQRQIDNYMRWQTQELFLQGKATLRQENFAALKTMFQTGQNLLQEPMSSQTARSWAVSEADKALGLQLQKLDTLGDQVANHEWLRDMEPKQKVLLQTLFSEYFSRLSTPAKKLIVGSYLGQNLLMDEQSKIEILVQNSGPQLQKLLQVVAREANLPPQLQSIFQKLESSVREVPWIQVNDILAQEKANYQFTWVEKKALGVGTMAQVHRAKLRLGEKVQNVVVRFLKPGIVDRVAEDGRILKELAAILDQNPILQKEKVPKLSPLVDEIHATLVAELDQTATIERQLQASKSYNKKAWLKTAEYKNVIEFHVPQVFPAATQSSKLMVQEMVFGQKLDKALRPWGANAAPIKKELVEQLAKLWIRELFFGQGFYHADLHMGNFLVQITDPQIRVNLLDFGMGGKITPELQRTVMLLGVGIKLQDAKLMAKAFARIGAASKTLTEAELQKRILKRMAEPQTLESGLETWTAWAMDQGLRLPYDFVNLNRGLLIVGRLLQDAGSDLTAVQIARDLVAEHPLQVYKSLVLTEKVALKDLIKLGIQEALSLSAPQCQALF